MSESVIVTSKRREATRQKLLDAAAQVFAEVGLDAASVEAICERAGFTRGAFYSNFETKDELMLALTERTAEEKIELVTERIQALRATGEQFSPAELVQRVLDVAMDEKMGILLTSEIRTRALRDPALAQAYLAWQAGLIERVAAVIEELGRTYRLSPRLPARDFAQLILQQWEDTSAYAVMAGLDTDALCTLANERTAQLAIALVDPA
ncbi:TetR/AcrR family transcriptional regulator [Microbacterium sp. SLBN-146]|uniref:TetR/AcrR family transcriptional regulator n=1 Tax=Microbacterium sp. SLBN-146 TaxID=2768457 RepID=UPI001152CD23|nr:TetR/AcrR family transcriptional regulator [Microbacterium sp. SLBN-146]TQJ31032.1 TetR family transcriptional regulator [Microbacterium sp. SLBN-146]